MHKRFEVPTLTLDQLECTLPFQNCACIEEWTLSTGSIMSRGVVKETTASGLLVGLHAEELVVEAGRKSAPDNRFIAKCLSAESCDL